MLISERMSDDSVTSHRSSRAQQVRGTAWQWTLNNYTTDELRMCVQMVDKVDNVQYICWGEEVGKEGTPHLQGFMKTKNTVAVTAIHKLFGKRAHVEKAKDVNSCIDYCHKKGGDERWHSGEEEHHLYHYGVRPKGMGARSDLDAVHESLMAGMTRKELSNEHFGQFVRYTRGLKDWFDLNESTPVRSEPKIYWLWGQTGSGKSYRIQTHLKSGLESGEVYCLTETTSGAWWDKYQGQKIVWMDDLRGSWMKMHQLLRVLQSSPCQVSARGAAHWLAADTFYITTNAPPVELYEDCDKVMRRVRDYAWVIQCDQGSAKLLHQPRRHNGGTPWDREWMPEDVEETQLME